MNRTIFQSILPISVFSIILFRETISYLLFLFPGEEILWYISFTLGHNILPFQLLIDNIISGYFGKLFILLLLISIAVYSWIGKNIFYKALTCHTALIIVCINVYITIGNSYGRSASIAPIFGSNILFISADNVLNLLLALSLLCGCIQIHFQYFQRLRYNPLS